MDLRERCSDWVPDASTGHANHAGFYANARGCGERFRHGPPLILAASGDRDAMADSSRNHYEPHGFAGRRREPGKHVALHASQPELRDVKRAHDVANAERAETCECNRQT